MSDRRKEGQFSYEQVRHVVLTYKPNPDDLENYVINERVIIERSIGFGVPLPKFPRFIERRTTMIEDERIPGGAAPVAFEVPAMEAVTLQEAIKEIDDIADEVEKESRKVAKAQLEEEFEKALKEGPGLWYPGKDVPGMGAPPGQGQGRGPGPLRGPFPGGAG